VGCVGADPSMWPLWRAETGRRRPIRPVEAQCSWFSCLGQACNLFIKSTLAFLVSYYVHFLVIVFGGHENGPWFQNLVSTKWLLIRSACEGRYVRLFESDFADLHVGTY